MDCRYCGKLINGRKRNYCGLQCRQTHHWRRQGIKTIDEHLKELKEKTKDRFGRRCQQCGSDFIFKPGGGNVDGGKFCSRKCYGLNRSKKFAQKVAREYINGYKEGASCKIRVRRFKQCGGMYLKKNGSLYCSKECRNKKSARAMRVRYKEQWTRPNPFLCKWCGKEVVVEYGEKIRAYCSFKCQQRQIKANSRHKRRAVMRGAFIERVDLCKVYERDRGRCHLCGGKISLKNKFPHPKSMSLDHVVPLSMGGTHEMKNVRLAHFICNSVKGVGVWPGGEQMLLF